MLANATITYVVNSYKLDVAQIANFQHGVKPQPKVIQDLNADLIQSRIRIIQICMSATDHSQNVVDSLPS